MNINTIAGAIKVYAVRYSRNLSHMRPENIRWKKFFCRKGDVVCIYLLLKRYLLIKWLKTALKILHQNAYTLISNLQMLRGITMSIGSMVLMDDIYQTIKYNYN
jgi:hypothetical protein